jgi:VIT1/CCC1 family predicted Fe2+/Mn2+ transporter
VPIDQDRAAELATNDRHLDHEQLFAEQEKITRLSRIRQNLFGSLDGLPVPLGVVSGVAGGTATSKIVIVAGVAEAFAGALSMDAGEFLSGKSEAQVQAAASRSELTEIATIPDIEQDEIELLFTREDLTPADAAVVTAKVTTSQSSWINTMVEKELGLSAEPLESPLRDSLAMGLSYLLGSLIPHLVGT